MLSRSVYITSRYCINIVCCHPTTQAPLFFTKYRHYSDTKVILSFRFHNIGWLKKYDIAYRCLFYLAGGPMIVGSLILAPTIWMKNNSLDLTGENNLVLMNESNPEINSEPADLEVQRLTVL